MEWEPECDAEIAVERAMWRENYWENSHCLVSYLHDSFLVAIKYLQFGFIFYRRANREVENVRFGVII